MWAGVSRTVGSVFSELTVDNELTVVRGARIFDTSLMLSRYVFMYFTPAFQCSTFTGIIPVFGQNLITKQWYWYVVFESGIAILNTGQLRASFGSAPVSITRRRVTRPRERAAEQCISSMCSCNMLAGRGRRGRMAPTSTSDARLVVSASVAPAIARAEAHRAHEPRLLIQ